MCLCVQSARGGGRRRVRRGSGFTGGLHHLLLHLPSLSGWTHTHSPAPPYDFCLPHTDFISLCLVSLLSFILSICAPQCVCTLSPSPSKQSKPAPMDSLQLPLAPGLVTHTVSLHWPLRGDPFVQFPRFHQISDYHYFFFLIIMGASQLPHLWFPLCLLSVSSRGGAKTDAKKQIGMPPIVPLSVTVVPSGSFFSVSAPVFPPFVPFFRSTNPSENANVMTVCEG